MIDEIDTRVAATTRHWATRFTANGTDYGDFAATIARIAGGMTGAGSGG